MTRPDLPNIALLGLMGSGKTTARDLLVDVYNYSPLSFAGTHKGGLRDVATRMWPDALDDRAKLQALGMAGRAIDEDVWVNAALRAIDPHRNPGPFVVDDVRFPNEVHALKGEGFITIRIAAGRNVRVERLRANGKLQDESQLDHPSEKALLGFPEDYRIINERITKAEFLEELLRVIAYDQRAVLA